MNTWLERPVVLIALLAAALLAALGLAAKTRSRLRGKSGLFYAALVMFLGTWACDASGLAASPPEKPANSTGSAAAQTPAPADPLPPELAVPGRLAKLKAVWAKLNQQGRKDPVMEDSPELEFGGGVPHETRQALLSELADALGCTQQALHQVAGAGVFARQESTETPECALSLPVRIVAHAALARIWAMGPDHTMMMHMLPPPDLIYHNRLKAKLQARFEALVAMVQQGKLSDAEYDAAMTQLELQVYHMVVFELVRPQVGKVAVGALHEPASPTPLEQQAKEWIASMRTWCTEESQRLEKGAEAEQQQLERVKQTCTSMEQSFEHLNASRPTVLALLKMLQE